LLAEQVARVGHGESQRKGEDMTTSSKDFRGKDLRGQSFKGQNLAGADFSDAQLGGVDFTGADLTGARFCRAVMGQSGVGHLIGAVAQIPVGFAAITILLIGNFFLVGLLQAALKTMHLVADWHNFEILVVYAVISSFFIYQAIQRNRPAYIRWFFFSPVALLTAVVAWQGEGGALEKLGSIPLIIAGIEPGAAALSKTGVLAAIPASGIFFILILHLSHRARQHGEPQLAYLRHLQLLTSKWWATQFSGQIRDADFTGANLRYVRFSNVSLQNCILTGASNLHLALTRGSLLETPQVRQLVTGSKSDNTPPCTDFSGLNLTGIHLAGMALPGYNFAHANLANANFSGCDLSNAEFTGANVTGANFCGATLTGAIIDNWNIDPHTRFDERTICEFVWLAPKKDSQDNPQRERNPPSGNFKPGDFAKLYQQISDTIDFILHSHDELEAIMWSVAHLNAHGAEIEVESVELKNDSVIVRLKVPATVSREEIYAEVTQQFVQQLTVAETKVQMLEQQCDKLEQQYDKLVDKSWGGMANRPTNYFIQQGNHNQQGADMPQNIVTQTGNTFSQSPVGIGQTVSITQSIAALPDSQAELKTLLTRLATLIEHSPLTDADKKDAMQQTGIIAEVAQQAAAPQQGDTLQAAPQASRAQRALDYIKTIFTALPEASAIIEQLQDLASQIGSWFGK
jgi:uncharacterized protein YjbI with pentapeptide repeats/sRNA-binding carbon storage regulator CsrA